LKTAGWVLLGQDADIATIGNHLFQAFQRFPSLVNWLNREAATRPSSQVADIDLEAAAVDMLKLLDQSPLQDFLSIAEAVLLASSAGQTALHLSASLGYERLSKELMARGVDPDQRDVNGYSALHFAAFYGQADCARVLVRGGADAYIFNEEGLTALEISRNSNRHSVVEFLEEVADTLKGATGERRSREDSISCERSALEPYQENVQNVLQSSSHSGALWSTPESPERHGAPRGGSTQGRPGIPGVFQRAPEGSLESARSSAKHFALFPDANKSSTSESSPETNQDSKMSM
jgi:hypothetical protein